MASLDVADSGRLEIDELSALCVRTVDGEPQLLGVGDSSYCVGMGSVTPLGGSAATGDLHDLVRRWEKGSHPASQWEGIADGPHGTVYVLQEHAGKHHMPSHVFIFDRALDARVGVLELRVEGDDEEWKVAWQADKNARAEALAIRARRRLLLFKQKDPIRVIEFEMEAEPSPTSVTPCHVVRSWRLTGRLAGELGSVNDATVHDDRVYVISRTSHVIARLGGLSEDATVEVDRVWGLPHEIRHPEALAIVEGHTPVVGADVGIGAPATSNVFRLSPLAH